MRLRTTLILLVVLLGLGAYVYWVELPQAEQEAKKKTLFELKADDATGVSLVYQDRSIELQKTGETWRLTKPLDVAADSVAVQNLLTAIADCEIKKDLETQSPELAPYGLDKPFVTVQVKLKDKELPAVALGKNTPVGSNTYLQRLDDKKIFLVASSFRSGMEKKVTDLRDKTILSFSDGDVRSLLLRGQQSEIRMERSGEDWKLAQPAMAADATAVRSFLSTLRSMRAVDFPNDEPSDLGNYGLDTPRLSISLFLGEPPTERVVRIGGENPEKKGEIYVQTNERPAVYAVSDWVWRDLNKDTGDFRDKTVLAFDREQIQSIELTRADGALIRMSRSGEDWSVAGAEARTAATAVRQWLGDVHELKGYEVAADSPQSLDSFGLQQPLLKVDLRAEGDRSVGTVLVGERTNEQGGREHFAMAAGGSTVFKIRDYVITRLNKQEKDFLQVPTPTPGGPPTAAPAGGAALDAGMPFDEHIQLDAEEHADE